MMSSPSHPSDSHVAHRRLATNFAEAYQLGELASAIRSADPAGIASAYDRWIASTDLSIWEREDLRGLGVPDAIQTDPHANIPVACWNQIPEEAGMLASQNDPLLKHFPAGPTRVLSLRRLDDFPEGSRLVPIADPRHVAVTNVVEILRGQIDDVQHHRGELSLKDGMAAAQELSALYQAGAAIGIRSLGMDQFIQWNPQLPGYVSYEQIPATVERHAATMLSHRALALHLCSKAFAREADLAERQSERSGEHVLDLLHRRLSAARSNLLDLAQPMNNALLRTIPDLTEPMAVHVIHRTSNKDGPALVLVPPATGASVRPIA